MAPLPLNRDGTINTAQYEAQYQRDNAVKNSQSKKSTVSKNTVDTAAEDRAIKAYTKAMKEASGYKRMELKAKLQDAKQDRQNKIESARISANASKYGSDRGLEGTKYGSDAGERNSQRSADASNFSARLGLQGTKYGSDAGERNSQRSADASNFSARLGLQGTQYSTDAGERNAALSAGASRYGADQSAASSRYGTDADLYKTNLGQAQERAKTALSFLNTYATMSGQPSNFLQASQYGRLGRQVEGMPGMISDLLGQSNPNAVPGGGNIAFRAGTYDMPRNQAQTIFGQNPLGLVGTRASVPDMPSWQGGQPAGGYTPPQQYYNTMGQPTGGQYAGGGQMMTEPYAQKERYVPSMTQDQSEAYGGGRNFGQEPPQNMSRQATMMGAAFAPMQGYAQGYGQEAQPHRGRNVTSSYGAAGGSPYQQPQGSQPYRAAGTGQGEQSQAYAQPYDQAYDQGQPSILDGGRVVADRDPTEDAFRAGTRELMRRGAQQIGAQGLERMTATERSMLESGIKDAGGIPADFFESYERSRMSNSGSGRAL